MDFKPLNETRCELGEGPVFDERRNALWYCDIVGKRILKADLETGDVAEWSFPSEVASLGVARSGRLVVALRDAVGMFDPDGGGFLEIASIERDRPETRLNDGKVGPDGAFWVGSMVEVKGAGNDRSAALYRVEPGGRVEKKVEGLGVSNGLAFSADGRTMFHSDSRGPWIDRWDFDPATGAISNRARIANLTEESGRPDGGATDAEGCYWSAGVSAARLNRFSPEGKLLESIPVPVACPTMPCFGGPGLTTLFVTSLTAGRPAELLERYPLTGITISAPSPVAGVPVLLFRDA